jgi:hypothetical protein
MHKVKFVNEENDTTLDCIDYNDLFNDDYSDTGKKTIDTAIGTVKELSCILGIEEPDICLMRGLFDDPDLDAVSYAPYEIKSLKNDLIVMSMAAITYKYNDVSYLAFIGIFAHEVYHCFDKHKKPIKKPARGNDTLSDKHEIYADAFAIWYLSAKLNISYEDAADIICQNEKIFGKEWYDFRIKKAKKWNKKYAKAIAKSDANLYKNIAKKTRKEDAL